MRVGNAELHWLGHSGFLIENSKRIYIDPYQLSPGKEKADIILITHSHYDHCSLQDIERIVRPGTTIVVPPDCQSKITKLENVNMQIAAPGDELNIDKVKIQTLPAYNKSKEFHPKSEEWNGYVLKLGKVIIYHAGDTDLIPEMEKLVGFGKKGNEFVALLPVGGGYTMNVDEAVQAATKIKPDYAIPMHYGNIVGKREDAEMFVKLCLEKGVHAELLERE